MSELFDHSIFQESVFQQPAIGLYDHHVFQTSVFQQNIPTKVFQRSVFQRGVFQLGGSEGFRFRNQGLPRYLDTLDEDEEEAIFLMTASEVFGA